MAGPVFAGAVENILDLLLVHSMIVDVWLTRSWIGALPPEATAAF
jgi:hypothetical protein